MFGGIQFGQIPFGSIGGGVSSVVVILPNTWLKVQKATQGGVGIISLPVRTTPLAMTWIKSRKPQ